MLDMYVYLVLPPAVLVYKSIKMMVIIPASLSLLAISILHQYL